MFQQRRTLLALTLALAATGAIAQDKYPSKPVTLIVPQAAGGANDAIARVIAQKLTEQLGQSFIVDNRTGAGGNVGTVAAARGKPDGYTLTVDLPSQTIRSSTGMSMSFDIDASRKHRLLEGLDDIGITLRQADRIRAYEARQCVVTPWLFS